jgi:hypothetical protein
MWTILRASERPLLHKTKKHLQPALSEFQKNSVFVADAFILSVLALSGANAPALPKGEPLA